MTLELTFDDQPLPLVVGWLGAPVSLIVYLIIERWKCEKSKRTGLLEGQVGKFIKKEGMSPSPHQ